MVAWSSVDDRDVQQPPDDSTGYRARRTPTVSPTAAFVRAAAPTREDTLAPTALEIDGCHLQARCPSPWHRRARRRRLPTMLGPKSDDNSSDDDIRLDESQVLHVDDEKTTTMSLSWPTQPRAE